MNITDPEQKHLHVSQDKLLAFVREVIGTSRGREDDQNPLPPGPWDPLIRIAAKHTYALGHPVPWRSKEFILGPQPEPWRVVLGSILARHPEIYDVLGGNGTRAGDEVSLNPQPLPPRYAFLAEVADAVAARAELLHEIASATRQGGTQQGIIIVGGFTSRFSDEWCGNGFRLRWPFPGPPPVWFADKLRGVDLVVIGAQLDQASREAYSPDLRQPLAAAGARFLETGLSRML